MKHALDGSGELMEAREGAASRGRCPYCGAPVILRHRAQAGGKGGVTYFWRHQDHANLECPARFSANSPAGIAVTTKVITTHGR